MSTESGNDSEVRYRIVAWKVYPTLARWIVVSEKLTFDEACSEYYLRSKAHEICLLEKDT